MDVSPAKRSYFTCANVWWKLLFHSTEEFVNRQKKDATHISVTHAFLYSYFINLYFLCLLLSVDNKISSEFQSLLEAVLLMEGKFYI